MTTTLAPPQAAEPPPRPRRSTALPWRTLKHPSGHSCATFQLAIGVPAYTCTHNFSIPITATATAHTRGGERR